MTAKHADQIGGRSTRDRSRYARSRIDGQRIGCRGRWVGVDRDRESFRGAVTSIDQAKCDRACQTFKVVISHGSGQRGIGTRCTDGINAAQRSIDRIGTWSSWRCGSSWRIECVTARTRRWEGGNVWCSSIVLGNNVVGNYIT